MRKKRIFATIGLSLLLASALQGAANAEETISSKSGSINVDCDQWGTARASVNLPQGSNLVSASAEWVDLHNIKESKVGQIQHSGAKYTAKGSIRGLDAQYTLGVRNCPGGGHGTLTISLKYR
jgi:hypothetical protein